MAIKDARTIKEEADPLYMDMTGSGIFVNDEPENVTDPNTEEEDDTIEPPTKAAGETEETSTKEETVAKPDEDVEEGDKPDENAVNYKGVADHFVQQGALDLDDEFQTDIEPTNPEYLKEAILYTVKKEIEQFKEQFNDPIAKRFLNYLEDGGDPHKFIQVYTKKDYASISHEEIKKSPELQKELIEVNLRSLGEDLDSIKSTVELYEERGVMEKQALLAHKVISKDELAERAAVEESAKSQKEAADRARKEGIEKLKNTVKEKEEIGGFKLNPKIKEQFLDYMIKPGKDGLTQLQKDAMDENKQLLMAYLYFTKFDFKALSKDVKTKTSEDLRANLGNFTDPREKKSSPRSEKKGQGYDKDVLSGFVQNFKA